jgi:hypothetical protein
MRSTELPFRNWGRRMYERGQPSLGRTRSANRKGAQGTATAITALQLTWFG